jgi:hypothetical protein
VYWSIFDSHAEIKNIIDVLGLDMLLTYNQDALHQLALLQEKACWTRARESFSQLNIRIPLDLETLPMMPKVGIKLLYLLYKLRKNMQWQ